MVIHLMHLVYKLFQIVMDARRWNPIAIGTRTKRKLSKKINNIKIDVVVHCAWQIRRIYGQKNLSYDWNLKGSENVFNFVWQNKLPKLIHFSTVASYGAQKDNFLDKFFTEQNILRYSPYHYAEEKRLVEKFAPEAAGRPEITWFDCGHYSAVGYLLPAIHEVEPDLVILDLQIGNMGGMAACMAIRLEEGVDRLPITAVLMLLDRAADVFVAHRAEADGWLIKPIDAFRLRKAASVLLDGYSYYEGVDAETDLAEGEVIEA